MVNWQEVGRVISAVHHHGHQGLKTSEIQKLVRKQPVSSFNLKQALDEAVRSGFLTVRNRRFFPCNWQELVSTRKRGARLPRARQTRGRRSARRRKQSHRGRKRTTSRREPSQAYARRRYVKSRKNTKSSHSSRRRRKPPRPRSRGRKVSRPARRKQTRRYRQVRAGSDDKIAPDGTNRVTPAEHATGKNYPPQ